MKAHHQLLGLAMRGPMSADRFCQRLDVARVVVVMVHKPELRDQAGFQTPLVDRIENAGRGGAAVLGVSGHDQHALHAFCFECAELLMNSRLAIAHGVTHRHRVSTLLQSDRQGLGLLFGEYLEG